MRIIYLGMLWACLISSPVALFAQTGNESEIAQLRAELAAIRADYESRIEMLEKRLDEAEREAAASQQTVESIASRQAQQAVQPAPTSAPGAGSNNNAFNPAVGVIFQGQAWAYDNDPDDYMIPRLPPRRRGGSLAGRSRAG